MNDRPNWTVRGLMVLIVLLLAINVWLSLIGQPGRYVRFGGEGVIILDTRSGKIYSAQPDKTPPVGVLDMVDRARSKK